MQIKYFGHGCGQWNALSHRRVFFNKNDNVMQFSIYKFINRPKCYGENICSKLSCLV